MGGCPSYGWVSYYFNLLLLTSMNHQRRVQFIQRKARAAGESADPRARLRTLLHCTDWPIDLLQSGEREDSRGEREEIEELQKEMVERYHTELLAQGCG